MVKIKYAKRLIFLVTIIFITCMIFFDVNYSKAAPSYNFPDIEQSIIYYKDKLKIPGIAIGVIKDNEVVYKNGFGTLGQKGSKIDSSTVFSIGSIGKTFTAICIMQLAERGKLNIDDPVEKYVPWVKITTPDSTKKVTIRHLLTHTSGFKRNIHDRLVWDIKENSPTEFTKKLGEIKTDRRPGEIWDYSNLGFVILGSIVEAVSGETYENYVEKNIFTPLEMKNTAASSKKLSSVDYTAGYETFFGVPKKFEHEYRNDLVCIGWIYTNVEDMTNYMMMFLNEGMFNGKRILSSESIEEMKKSYISIGYGDTFGLSLFKSGELYLHGGDHENYHAIMTLNPKDKNATIMMYNMNHYFTFEVVKIINLLFKKNLSLPSQALDSLAIDLANGNSHTIKNTLDIGSFYIWFNLIFALIILLIISSFIKLRKRKRKVSNKKIIRILVMVQIFLINFIIPIFVLSLPIITKTKLILIYKTYPDLLIALDVISILLIIMGILKVIVSISYMKRNRENIRFSNKNFQ